MADQFARLFQTKPLRGSRIIKRLKTATINLTDERDGNRQSFLAYETWAISLRPQLKHSTVISLTVRPVFRFTADKSSPRPEAPGPRSAAWRYSVSSTRIPVGCAASGLRNLGGLFSFSLEPNLPTPGADTAKPSGSINSSGHLLTHRADRR